MGAWPGCLEFPVERRGRSAPPLEPEVTEVTRPLRSRRLADAEGIASQHHQVIADHQVGHDPDVSAGSASMRQRVGGVDVARRRAPPPAVARGRRTSSSASPWASATASGHLDLEAAQGAVPLVGEGLAGQRDADGERVLPVQRLVEVDIVRRDCRRGCDQREQNERDHAEPACHEGPLHHSATGASIAGASVPVSASRFACQRRRGRPSPRPRPGAPARPAARHAPITPISRFSAVEQRHRPPGLVAHLERRAHGGIWDRRR